MLSVVHFAVQSHLQNMDTDTTRKEKNKDTLAPNVTKNLLRMMVLRD